MIVIARVTRQSVGTFKAIRLRALKEAPYAFSSTSERESQFSESEWLARVDRMNGERGAGFLAKDGESPCGLVGALLPGATSAEAQVVSMWTAPEYRRHGIGRLLIDEVAAWARGRNCTRLQLMVTSVNYSAILFYGRLGFVKTGRTEPYPNDPTVLEYEMSRSVV